MSVDTAFRTAEARRSDATLVDEVVAEMRRVRDHVMPAYLSIGAPGIIALTLMRGDLDRAAYALAEQDAVKCFQALGALKGYAV